MATSVGRVCDAFTILEVVFYKAMSVDIIYWTLYFYFADE